MVSRGYYQNNINNFLLDTDERILGILAKNNEFELGENQKKAWIYQIKLLKNIFANISDGFIVGEETRY